jgi:hypothetical protein
MVDPEHPDRAGGDVDLVDDAVGPTPGRPQAFELPVERVPYPGGILGQGTEQELDDGDGGLLREAGERPLR